MKNKISANYKKSVKNPAKITKISKKSHIFKQMSKDFVDWVNGIEEDEPLKTEAKNIYFIVEFRQNDIAFSYSADEKIFDVFDYGTYFPLEAEYFNSGSLKQISNLIFDKKSISISFAFDMLKSVVFSNVYSFDFFENHNIFYGKRFSKVSKSSNLYLNK